MYEETVMINLISSQGTLSTVAYLTVRRSPYLAMYSTQQSYWHTNGMTLWCHSFQRGYLHNKQGSSDTLLTDLVVPSSHSSWVIELSHVWSQQCSEGDREGPTYVISASRGLEPGHVRPHAYHTHYVITSTNNTCVYYGHGPQNLTTGIIV